MKFKSKYSFKTLLSNIYVHRIILLTIKVSNYILYVIFGRFIKQQIDNYHYKNSYKDYSKIKIIYIIPNLGVGGAERQLVNLINHLSNVSNQEKYGKFEILLVCFNHQTLSNNFYFQQLTEKIRIIDLSEGIGLSSFIKELRKNIKFFWLGKNLIYMTRLEEIIATEKPNVLHAWLDTPSICGGIAGVLNKVPNIILSTRSINPTNFFSNRFYRKSVYQVLNNYSQVTFLNNSKAGALSYEKWLHFEKDRIEVVHNGFEIETFRTFQNYRMKDEQSSTITIGGVMRFAYEKNLKLWLQSAKILSQKAISVKFVLIGDGPELPRVKRYIKKLELSRNITLVKSINNVYEYMSKFDVLLLTSRAEGLPNVLIEAQLLGIPVVSTESGGAGETFINNSSGMLINEFDPKLIANSLYSLVSDKEKLVSFSINAVDQASQRFDIAAIAQEYVNIYNKI